MPACWKLNKADEDENKSPASLIDALTIGRPVRSGSAYQTRSPHKVSGCMRSQHAEYPAYPESS